jgi:hypothetical protein
MEPITREEYYLAKIAGTYKGKTPKPVTIEEYYLATMAGDYSGNTPQPVTRLQYYMAKVAGVWGGSIPAPVTRLEYYWAAIANGEGEVFPPVTREEHFLVLVADAYSVVLTVVTGNPALLEGVKGSRFTSLTLHGKSTQVSTTGAQLFDVSNADVVQMYIANSGIGNFIENYSVVIPIKPSTSYTISEKNKKIFRVAITEEYPIESAPTLFKEVVDAYKNITTPNNLPNGNFLMIQLYGNFNHAPDFSGLMLNEGSTTKPYEPYTGGKPSPSPEYPQEIESAGKSGKIGVTVTGTNLLPFEVGQKGNGFEAFADGVQIDTDRNVDIYAVGRNDSLVESGYDEFALMTAGKYYIYSDTRDVYLYVVVWRKGRNVVLGSSNEGVARQIEIMDGDKFRIFFRTAAAFKGKVKAMITRIPMNATSYEPYKPAQKLIIPTPNGLPGIPVSSDGNYTDADGRQWVCDEVDFKKGVYVQRIGKRTITSKDVFHKSGMSTDDVNYFSLGNFSLHIGTIGEKDVLMSNCFVAGINHGFGAWGKIFLSSAFDDKLYFSVEAQKYPDEETFKQWAVENGLMFLYQLVDIIETPLAAEELSAYKTLCTYSPTTTVINDAEAGMSVGYAKMK